MTWFRSERRRRGDGSDGFVIVAVLWILGALATLAAIYALYVTNSVAAFRIPDDRLAAESLISAGIEVAAYQITATNPRPAHGSVGFRLGRNSVSVQYESELARIDVNKAPGELLAGLFTSFGVQQDAATRYMERIVSWRTAAVPGESDAEQAYYRMSGSTYGPRGGPFPHIMELGLVLGLPPSLIHRAEPFLTVYSGSAQINVLDAPPQVLAALPGMTPIRLHDLLARRSSGPQNGQTLMTMLGPAARYATTDGGQTRRLKIRVGLDGGRRSVGAEVVIVLLDQDTEPYRVLSCRSNIDGLPID